MGKSLRADHIPAHGKGKREQRWKEKKRGDLKGREEDR